jgi:membrane protein required for beta-lactamase induction
MESLCDAIADQVYRQRLQGPFCVSLRDLQQDQDVLVTLESAFEVLAHMDSFFARLLRYKLALVGTGGDAVAAWCLTRQVLLTDLFNAIGVVEKQKAQRRVVTRLEAAKDPALRVDVSMETQKHVVWVSLETAIDVTQRSHTPNKKAATRTLCLLSNARK